MGSAWFLLLVGVAGACGGTRHNAVNRADGGAGDAAEHAAGNGGREHPSDGKGQVSGAGGRHGDSDVGQAGDGCSSLEAAGAGGMQALVGCPTLKVPTAPFLFQAMPDPGNNVCQDIDDCSIGPWLVTFRTLPDGELEAGLVSTQEAFWPSNHEPEAAEFRLHAEDGVYYLAARQRATLASYTYGHERVPGVCLAGDGVAFGTPSDGTIDRTVLAFFDDTGDGVADVVELGGRGVTLGERGGDYEDDCGDQPTSLHAQGRVVETAVDLSAGGDVLKPELRVNGGFLKQGTAQVFAPPHSWVDAQPLAVSGFIYGFAASVVLQPGRQLTWRVDGVDLFDRQVAGQLALGQSEVWPLVNDGSFESFASGADWGAGDATIEANCNPNDDQKPLPPIAGSRSLVIGPNGYQDSFRFSRTGSQTHLSFVAFGNVGVELATVGTLNGEPFWQAPVVTAADCQRYAEFCSQVPADSDLSGPARTLELYGVKLPPGASDVLVRLYNQGGSVWGAGGGTDLCVDDLRLE